MGSLKPGATYVYERNGGTVYAREMGAAPDTRQVVGWDYNPEFDQWRKDFSDAYLWSDIFKVAETNPALQKALENVKIIYYMAKENGSKT